MSGKCACDSEEHDTTFMTLMMTKEESATEVMAVQNMLYTCRMLVSINLQVELPMLLKMDSKGAVDLANNWGVDGQT